MVSSLGTALSKLLAGRRIGRATDRKQDAECVFDRFRVDDLFRGQLPGDHRDRGRAALLGNAHPIRRDSRR